MWNRSAAIEWHMGFKPDLNKPGRECYDGRLLATNAALAFQLGGVDGMHLQFLRNTGIGPKRVVEVDGYADVLHGAHADAIRELGHMQFFWYGAAEEAVTRELGLNGFTTTPARMETMNCKAHMRRIANAAGVPWITPLHREVHTAAEVRDAFRWLASMENVPAPHANHEGRVIVKRTDLLSGDGMATPQNAQELATFCNAHVNGTRPILVEAFHAKNVSASVHWNVTKCGYKRAKVTIQCMNGVHHAGNRFASRDEALLPAWIVKQMYHMGEVIVQFWWRRGYTGPVGLDFLIVFAPDGKTHIYVIEPNIFRPPAPRYGMALGSQLHERLNDEWAIEMVDMHPAVGAAYSFTELAWLLRGPRAEHNLLFNGLHGVVPVVTGLLPRVFIGVCVGKNPRDAHELATQVRQRIGEPVHQQ